jgi:hypothetical protein
MENATPILPLLPPPDGQVSNFVNPQSNGSHVSIANGICLSLSISALALRMYTRSVLIKKVGLDDCKSFFCCLLCSRVLPELT